MRNLRTKLLEQHRFVRMPYHYRRENEMKLRTKLLEQHRFVRMPFGYRRENEMKLRTKLLEMHPFRTYALPLTHSEAKTGHRRVEIGHSDSVA